MWRASLDMVLTTCKFVVYRPGRDMAVLRKAAVFVSNACFELFTPSEGTAIAAFPLILSLAKTRNKAWRPSDHGGVLFCKVSGNVVESH